MNILGAQWHQELSQQSNGNITEQPGEVKKVDTMLFRQVLLKVRCPKYDLPA